ncbi:MAG: RtcB family protein [Candidatus Hydrogenedentota bacterium]|nr:MAG: RtcB family protein [Candidatus Hydrogenedentota bacterium]
MKRKTSLRDTPVPCAVWGKQIPPEAQKQIDQACRLPVAVRAALMPDAHVGYGLPIGGVLATRDSVIPYAVGVDIACRMKLSLLDLPISSFETYSDRLKDALQRETRFGIGAAFRKRRSHPVMDEDWNFSKITREIKDKAYAQLGTSGSGNHFVEFGILELEEKLRDTEAGRYLALLSHSGSRGPGHAVAQYYSRRAKERRKDLPPELRNLAWLELDSAEGKEYWIAMELMGRYASANHELIHTAIAHALGAEILISIENHHNFAWKERHDGRNVIVHRKGATPAGKGQLGIIPGTMASPAFLVEGMGEPRSLRSAAHGAGRILSRKEAKKNFSWSKVKKILEDAGVELISAGLDEVPMAYKNIVNVMEEQKDLVRIRGIFHPRIVKMAPSGSPPED